MLKRGQFTIDMWREFVEGLSFEGQNELIRRFLAVGLASERPGPNGTFIYKLRFPIGKVASPPKNPGPTDEQVVYEQQLAEWVRQYDALIAKGRYASAAEWVRLHREKPKPPRVRVKQYDNLIRLVVKKRRNAP
jgi:hypothetical protein